MIIFCGVIYFLLNIFDVIHCHADVQSIVKAAEKCLNGEKFVSVNQYYDQELDSDPHFGDNFTFYFNIGLR